MAISFVSRQNGSANGTTISFSHQVLSGTDRFLIASFTAVRGGSFTFSPATSATYGGASMTALSTGSTQNSGVSVFYLINPPVGTANVVANFSESSEIRGDSLTFNGVHQTVPIGDTDVDTNGTEVTTALSTEITGLYTNSWSYNVSDAVGINLQPNVSIESGEISRWDYNFSLSSRLHELNGTTRVATGQTLTAGRTFGNNCQSILYTAELRSADGAAVLNFTENLKLTPTINKQTNKSLFSNLILSPTISLVSGTSVNFLSNIKLTSLIDKKTFLNLLSNLKLSTTIEKIFSKTFLRNVKLTSSINNLLVTLLNFTSSLSISSTIRMIKDGIRVGIWEKVVKTTSDWTKQAKSLSIWTKQDKEL